MKRLKSTIAILLSVAMLVSSFAFFAKKSFADEHAYGEGDLVVYATNEYEFNPSEYLELYAWNSTPDAGHENMDLPYRMDITGKEVIPIGILNSQKQYVDEGEFLDGIIDGRDATRILTMTQGLGYTTAISNDNANTSTRTRNYEGVNEFVRSAIMDKTKVAKEDIEIITEVTMPKIDGYIDSELKYVISSKSGITQETENISKQMFENEKKVYLKLLKERKQDSGASEADFEEGGVLYSTNVPIQRRATVTAKLKDGSEYKMIIADDNNFYMLKTKEKDEPKQDEPKKDFDTELSYSSTPQGKLEDDTYYPPYYDDENNKKDVDATAIITSQTDEGIKSTNGVDLKEDGTPNSEGWYYPDVEDKTVIARVYPFDDYDNTTYNGIVPKEEVKLVGLEGGTDSQTPAIEWTFRIKNVDETENQDGSITWVITYNLPVDENSIPDGWAPIYDADGKTIHKITKTVKKGEDYDKDVTVKQNGTDKTATTHVSKKWPKPTVIPQAGETLLVVIAVAVVALFAVSRYYRMSNNKK